MRTLFLAAATPAPGSTVRQSGYPVGTGPVPTVERYGKELEPHLQACKSDPDIVGPCFLVHKRLSAYNGGPAWRLWPIGTNQMLVVHDDISPNAVGVHLDWSVQAYGDFAVSPFAKERPGVMQSVCIESATHVVYKDSK
jgi:hypothetical protein